MYNICDKGSDNMKNIKTVVKKLNIKEKDLVLYGKYMAKIDYKYKGKPRRKRCELWKKQGSWLSSVPVAMIHLLFDSTLCKKEM